MKYFWIFIFLYFPSLVFAQIRIGILPVELKGKNILFPQFKENIENTIYKNLTVSPQIESIFLKEEDIKKKTINVNYFLKTLIEVSKDKAKIELNLIDAFTLKTFYSTKETTSLSEISLRLTNHLEEIKNKILSSETIPAFPPSEEKSFFSKINPFPKIGGIFSRLISKKEEFDIKVPIPPPPPPPGYNLRSYSSSYSPYTQPETKVPSGVPSEKKVYPESPWQWF
ncbi:MAG: hypothetical protein C0190_04995 [Thermodesulfobacterium geofontis]|uniref:Uncharacterized protein n=2 Tax=Thermodesulfobacterium geofontis TaxID=1295609 RepID=A0A2N7PN51_9BACT|nr:MAG: hypothetical protein C0190_04995 [Thermodesulfobacterium geofontis]